MKQSQEGDQQVGVTEIKVPDGREDDGHQQRADECHDVRGLREREIELHHHLASCSVVQVQGTVHRILGAWTVLGVCCVAEREFPR